MNLLSAFKILKNAIVTTNMWYWSLIISGITIKMIIDYFDSKDIGVYFKFEFYYSLFPHPLNLILILSLFCCFLVISILKDRSNTV